MQKKAESLRLKESAPYQCAGLDPDPDSDFDENKPLPGVTQSRASGPGSLFLEKITLRLLQSHLSDK